VAVTTTAPLADQRERILGIALDLMAGGGVHAMSMRKLATACSLNVASIYHYFPSKEALVAEVVAHQSYEDLLNQVPPVDRALEPPARLAALLSWVWSEMSDHDAIWKLLVGESLRGNEQMVAAAFELSTAFEAALGRWLDDLFTELPADRVTFTSVLRGSIYGFFLELMAIDGPDRKALLAPRADDLGAVLFATPR
jgi:AcrR family transcriptional regulator